MEDSSGNKFEKAFKNNPKDYNTIIISLDKIIKKIVNSCFTKFCGSIDAEDISQEVRFHLWSGVLQKGKLTGKTPEEAYKYLTTVIKTWAGRVIVRSMLEVDIEVFDEEKTPVNEGAFIFHVFSIEYAFYINELRNNCVDILNGERVLNYLAPRDNEEAENALDFAGFSSRTFYKAFDLLKKRAKELHV